MILNNEKTTNNSIVQTAYTYFCDCLASFKEMQPDFDYTVNYGTNSNDDDILEDKNKFNFVVYTGIPELIPSHWMEINGQSEIFTVPSFPGTSTGSRSGYHIYPSVTPCAPMAICTI